MEEKENKMEEDTYLKVETIDELKFICNDDPQDFFILLSHGLISRKRIFYDDISELFFVEDMVTSSSQEYTLQQLKTNTNIVNAIEKGAFYLEADENEISNLHTSIALLAST